MKTKRNKRYKAKYEQIETMYKKGLSGIVIAEFFGVTRQAIYNALKRRSVKIRKKIEKRKDDRVAGLLTYAIKKGAIIRKDYCEQCNTKEQIKNGKTNLHAHHDDYNKPLTVRFLCTRCHRKWHQRNKSLMNTTKDWWRVFQYKKKKTPIPKMFVQK